MLFADDILSSGESILDLAGELKNRGAKRIFPIVSFAFSPTDWMLTRKLTSKLITKVFYQHELPES